MTTNSAKTRLFSIALVLTIALGASPAFAQVLMHEVQVVNAAGSLTDTLSVAVHPLLSVIITANQIPAHKLSAIAVV